MTEVLTAALSFTIALGAAVRTLLAHAAFNVVALRAVGHTGAFVKQILLLATQTVISFIFT